MTIESGLIVEVLRASWPDAALTGAPTPVTGGQWATMLRLGVRGTPDGVPGDLVLRVVPHAEMGAKELAVQAAMAEAGVATPTVRLSGPAGGPFIDAWALMDFVAGEPLLAGLDGAAAIRRLPRILGRLPRQLADTMAALHRVDSAPVIARVRVVAPSVALTVDELWVHLRAGATVSGCRSLVAALDRLADARPEPSESVVCHGDLHPFNLLADGDRITVLDWTAAVLAPPGFDVALTWLLLRHPPLAAPAALRPVIGSGAALLARRFLQRYRVARPGTDLSRLDWYAALHAARILIDLAIWTRDDDPRANAHPWQLVAPGAASTLNRVTSVQVAVG